MNCKQKLRVGCKEFEVIPASSCGGVRLPLAIHYPHEFGTIHMSVLVEIRSQGTNTDFLQQEDLRREEAARWKCHTDLKLPAEVREELYPELSVVHVVEPHLPLDLVRDGVPAGVPIAPLSPPLVLVSPRVTNPFKDY